MKELKTEVTMPGPFSPLAGIKSRASPVLGKRSITELRPSPIKEGLACWLLPQGPACELAVWEGCVHGLAFRYLA